MSTAHEATMEGGDGGFPRIARGGAWARGDG
jgi:hypothetical protein